MQSDQLCACGCGQYTTISRTNRNGLLKGQPHRYLPRHHRSGGRKPLSVTKSYRALRYKNKLVFLHRARAEKALGKPLPPNVHVHHADGSKRDDAPLVICQDASYHRLLHRRMRILRAGGNPNTDLICSDCRHVKAADQFPRNRLSPTGHSYHCYDCKRIRDRMRGTA